MMINDIHAPTQGRKLMAENDTPDRRCGSVAPISLRRCRLGKGHEGWHTSDGVGGWNRSRFDYSEVEDRESDEAAGILEGAVDLSWYDTGE